ncbi:hypothetical protein WK08_30250 [Burkholderia ubonensis]|nr:hypothetical protein WK08_30250 [Burkholderia ubonensis]
MLRLVDLLFYNDDGTVRVVDAEAQNRTLFGDLPLTAVPIATEYQHTARFDRRSVTVKRIVVAKTQPATRNSRCLRGVVAREIQFFKPRQIRVVQVLTKAKIYLALSLDTLYE